MQLKLRLLSDGRADDVVVDVAPHTTVGALAVALFPEAVPSGMSATELGLVVDVDRPGRRVVAPDATIDGSGIRSGSSIGPSTARLASAPTGPAATLTVHDGPDAPATFPLPVGRTSVGRGDDRDLRFTDRLMSKRHAHVVVGDVVEIIDDASANGVLLNGRPVDRAVLHTGDRLTLGGTTISVAHRARRGGHTSVHANDVPFNRSPRLDPRYEGITLLAPEPPQPPAPQRFPVAMVIAPVGLAVALYLFTQNILSILFFALSPVLIVGSWFETRSANRKQIATETARFRSSLADLADQLEYAQRLERSGRRHEHPSVVELIEAVEDRGPLVWTRRPEHDSFGRIRLGLGTQPSRNAVELPASNKTLPGLWRELTDTVARFVDVAGVPVVADLRACGNVGVGGPGIAAEPVLRGLLAQCVALHSPAEFELAAFAPGDGWDWLKWLPHTSGSRLAGDAAEAATLATWVESLLDDRLAACPADDASPPLPLVLVVAHDDAPIARSRLVQIAERGPAAGVHVVWFAADVERLPAACRTFVDIDANTGRGRAGFVQGGVSVTDLAVEPAGDAATTRLARTLSPMIDSGAPIDTSSDLPRSVAFVDLAGHEIASAPDAVADRWRENESVSGAPPPGGRDRGLRALVGRTVDGPLHLDLRTQGPHALVGGTTGSGKSEFLQSWILGMATDNSPSRVTFLLVDYKGGAAFADCVELPHCVGLVTDLSPHLVRRALASLDAELRHREQLLHDKRAKDLLELERRNDPDCPPSLVIVVDEFAALVSEVPEFVDGVVNIAQRGRSLGLHLVLATQRPAGVIKDNLRANTNLRIALRMADEGDSDDVIGTTRAALFDPDVPGRAIVKAGPGRVTGFQAAYSGGRHAGRTAPTPIEVASLRFGVGTPRPVAAAPREDSAVGGEGPTDIERIVHTIGVATSHLGIGRPRRPWLPELADRYCLEALPTDRTDTALVFGVADDPGSQQQPVVAFHPDVDGNMAIFGTGGTGKSGALRAIGVAAGFGAARGGPTWVHGLDFGSRGLQPLSRLPHVGSVIPGDDGERVQRLLRRLESMMDERSDRYARAEATTITEFRRRSGHATEPRVLVLVDGVGAFRTEYEGGLLTRWWELFLRIVAEGRALGIHVVMSADRPSSVPSNLASAVQRELVLRLAGEMDYAMVDVPVDAYGPGTPAGRGFLDGREVQVAVVGGSGDLAEQGVAMQRCAVVMERNGVTPAPPVGSLPARVVLSELPTDARRPTIGIGDDTLGAIGFVPEGVFLVAGAPQSGTSTAAATMIRSLAAVRSDTDFVLFGRRRSPLTTVTTWAAAAHGPVENDRLASKLAGRLGEAAGRSIVVVIEAVGELLDTEADMPLQELLRVCRDQGIFVIAEGETSSLTGSWPLLQAVKSYRCGIVLQPDQMDGDTLFKTPFPRTTRPEFPAGRGLMVQGGQVTKVQVAVPE
ncbi:MAG: FtsK/SpoIIIE domain-containing protein [Ilumatobacteraceae bacterium]|nr:FtsK/SpoIIIE domain-containing protein [Ilumatobacteraceae bacterium]